MRALVLVFLLSPATAFGQALVINGPGNYTLTSDLSDPNTVIQVNANDVDIYLNGKTVRCNPPNPTAALTVGIAAGNRSRVSVHGPGTVTNCFFGLQLSYGASHLVDGVTISGNRYIGINAGWGINNVVRNITCASIGGFTAEAYAICINGIGVNGRIENVDVDEIYRQSGSTAVGEGLGVLVEANATGVSIRNADIRNETVRPNTIGIWVAAGASVTAENVVIAGFATPVANGGTYTEVTTAPAPPPPPPPTPGGRWFRVCIDNGTTCFEGYLQPTSGG